MSGVAHVGSSPLVGATVSLWTAGSTTPTHVGSNVATDTSGNFTLNYDCPASNAFMYVLVVAGETSGSVANNNLRMISAIGTCGSMPSAIVVNELTSVAAAYALNGFSVNSGTNPGFAGSSQGLSQAFVTLTNLIDPTTGAFPTTVRETNTTVIKQRMNTVANALAACNISSGAAACTELFSCARANATYASTGQPCTGGTTAQATDTMHAALAIVQNAGTVSMAGIFDVASTSAQPYAGELSAMPQEWTLPLVFAVRNFGPLAIDVSGHVWLLAPDPHPANPSAVKLAVTEVDSDGSFLSPHQTGHDWSAGGVSSIDSNDITNMAIDLNGNVWVAGSTGVVAKLTSSGAGAPGAPFSATGRADDTSAIVIDTANNAWISSGNGNDVYEFTNAGVPLTPSGGLLTNNCPCDGMAADGAGNVWTVSTGSGQFLAEITAARQEQNIQGPPSVGGNSGLSQLTSIATDAAGTLWITDRHYHAVWDFTPTAGGSGTWSSPFNNAAASGTTPKGIAVDGAGHKWVANNTSPYPSITELSADGATNLSSVNGFAFQVNSGIAGAYAIAIDRSGNVWWTDGSNSLVEMVGAGAPTLNPVAAAIKAGNFAAP